MNRPGAGRTVELVEVGPRDGLQNEAVAITTESKVALIQQLVDAGLRRIEAVSFVHPQRVPQMADAEAVMAALPAHEGVTFIGLVLNEKGAVRALQSRVNEVGTVVAASDSFGLRNQNQTAADTVTAALQIMRLARRHGRSAQACISVAFGCPFEGRIPVATIVEMAEKLAAAGPREIVLADTIGVAVPDEVSELIARVQQAISPIPIRAHFHNTRNTAIANVWAAISAGARSIDSSVGGIGGCPFAPRATGNVATEDVLYLLNHSGLTTGVDIDAVIRTAAWCGQLLNRQVPGMVSRAGDFPRPART
ncbi:MAG TPA: hydroxymethylglutaryl-CoA lyase [Steroidobacteraceae bacterium]|nr:hydroxymethylglutaryl-CoA lyase [Steroidobacteraceae bacterium]